MTRHRRAALGLTCLTLAFAARVAGQALVALTDGGWVERLIPMRAWYSGLIPYRWLWPIQAVILAAQGWHLRQWWAGGPRRPKPRLGRALVVAGGVYAAGMGLRYVIAVTLHGGFGPAWWSGGLVPVVFHHVLAGYFVLWGRALQKAV